MRGKISRLYWREATTTGAGMGFRGTGQNNERERERTGYPSFSNQCNYIYIYIINGKCASIPSIAGDPYKKV
jgi:hypothetical protein